MVCRSTPGNSALTTYARLHSGIDDVQVLSLFHEARNDAPATAARPSQEEYQAFLNDAISRVNADTTLSAARRGSIVRRLESAMSQRPDARTYYAWRTIGERAQRARAALDAQFDRIATRTGSTREQVQAAFRTISEQNRQHHANRETLGEAPSAPEHLQIDEANLPSDRATRYALMALQYSGLDAAADGERGATARARAERMAGVYQRLRANQTQCPDCGQFTGPTGHNCPEAPVLTASRAGYLSEQPNLEPAASRVTYNAVAGGFVTTDGETSPTFTAAVEYQAALQRLYMDDENGIAYPGLNAVIARLDTTTDGQIVTTDGERWDNRIAAFRHERTLAHAEHVNDPNRTSNIREAVAALSIDANGNHITTDGRVFGAGNRHQAILHQRDLPRDLPRDLGNMATQFINDPPFRADLERFADRVHERQGRWADSNGDAYISRAYALAAEARRAAQNCPTCGQFAGEGHTCPQTVTVHPQAEPQDLTPDFDATLAALRERLVGPVTTSPTDAPVFAPGQRCENCGEFTGRRHVCAENRDGEPGYTYDEHGTETAPEWAGEASFDDVLAEHASEAADAAARAAHAEWQRDVRDAAEAEIAAEITQMEDRRAAAPTPTRRRTPVRTYNGDHGHVQMINRSQALANLRQAGIGEPSDLGQIDARITDYRINEDGTREEMGWYRVTGGLVATATSARARRGQDRIAVETYQDQATHGERALQCTCPDYRARYDCVHVRQAVEQVTAVLNARDAVAVAPPAAVEEVRAALHAEYQDSLAAQQQARETFAAAPTVSYRDDMAAFQAAYDAAKERIDSGETALPYMTENATGGLGARDGGRSFGIEIEVDFPDDMTYTAKNRVAREIYEAGLSQGPEVRGWHWVGRAGGGYTDAPNNWAVEFDRSVDDVGGNRGCEIVSPILYDEPQTWENLAKICEIVERNGGKVTPRTGLHINVGAADYDHTVENHNRLLRLSESYEDVLVRCGHNKQSGSTHRGRTYCTPSQIPADGYRRIRDAQEYNGHRSMVNLQHVPAEGQRITSSTRVEVRIFDGSIDPGRIQINAKMALGMVNAAVRGVTPDGPAEPAGTHRARNAANRTSSGRPRRLRGEDWVNDTASFRSFADAIFTRPEDKAQLVHTYADTRWQPR